MLNQRGSSLIEVLVALVIMTTTAIGLLQAQTMRVQQLNNDIQHQKAIMLVGDIVERVRANPKGIQRGLYAEIDTADDYTETACNPCTVEHIRDRDIERWAEVIAVTLSKGRGSIELSDASKDKYRISVSWENLGEQSELVMEGIL